MNEQRAFAAALWSGLVGSVVMLAGLGVDATLHTNDHTLVERESLWSLGNPGHLLLAVGITLVVAGIFTATYLHVRGHSAMSRST